MIDYSNDRVQIYEDVKLNDEQGRELISPALPEWATVRWINVEGPFLLDKCRRSHHFASLQ